MHTWTVHVLLVEDSPTDAVLIQEALRGCELTCDVSHVTKLEYARAHLASAETNVILLDLDLPDGIGLDTIRAMRSAAPNVPIVVTTGRDDMSMARIVEAGGQDIMSKNHLESESLSRCIRHALQRKEAEAAVQKATYELAKKNLELEQSNAQLRNEIAERAAIERKLEAARQVAVAANRAKTEFLACMSHELRTPLNAVIGFSDGLLSRISQHPLNAHQVNRIERIRQAGQHLLHIINDILDVAKVEAGEMRVDLAEFPPDDLVREVADIADGIRQNKKDVELVMDVGPNLPTMVCDRAKVRQILLNLMSNAFKFTEHGRILLRVMHQGDCIVFTVEDTGEGIPADMLHTIFDKFRQVDGSARRARGGTGLGLTICQQFTDLLNGSLSVRSERGVGSCFKLALPVRWDAATAQACDRLVRAARHGVAPPEPRGQPTILCIDDNVMALRVMEQYLISAGYNVLPALHGESGLRLARGASPAAILLDVMMPDIDGYEVLRELKSSPLTRHIPVIITTAQEGTDEQIKREADGYLVKPLTREALLRELRRHLDQGAQAA